MKTTKKRSMLRLAVSVGFLAAALFLPPAGAPLAKESPPAAPAPGSEMASLKIQPAEISTAASGATMLSSARAGNRIVAVGDRGIVLLSDTDGKEFRQAKSVPVRSTLTAVCFVDEKSGWAVGHWGVVLRTDDAGENWTLQRSDTTVDQPLFSVHFRNRDTGWAVGLWSLVVATKDGGKTWIPVRIPPPPGGKLDLEDLERRLTGQATVKRNAFLLRFDREGFEATVFPDGRAIVKGTNDPARARTFYAKFIGT